MHSLIDIVFPAEQFNTSEYVSCLVFEVLVCIMIPAASLLWSVY